MGRLERAICALEEIIVDTDKLGRQGDLSAARLNSLGQQLLTYIRSDRTALVDYGARYRAARTCDQPGGIRGQFLGCEKDGQKPANALVPLGRSSHAAGQSGDGERQSTTTDGTSPACLRCPSTRSSANPAYSSRIKPQTFAALYYSPSRRPFWPAAPDEQSSIVRLHWNVYQARNPVS